MIDLTQIEMVREDQTDRVQEEKEDEKAAAPTDMLDECEGRCWGCFLQPPICDTCYYKPESSIIQKEAEHENINKKQENKKQIKQNNKTTRQHK